MILNMITQWSWAWSCIGSEWTCAWSYLRGLHCDLSRNEWMTCRYLSTHTVYRYKIKLFHYLGGMAINIGKWILENITFHEILNWAKRLKNRWTSSQHMPIAIAKCTLTGLVQLVEKSCQKWVRFEVARVYSHNIASSFHFHTCLLEFKMLLPSVKTTTKDPSLHKGNTGSESLE